MRSQKRASRFLAALLVCVLAAAFPVRAQAVSVGSFSDISSSDWYYGAVDFVVGRGLYQGTSGNTFSPNSGMTRAMFVTVLGRYAGVDASKWIMGAVTGSGVNLRSGAGTDHDVVTTMSQGTMGTILGVSGDWYNVRVNGQTGYVRNDYFKPVGHLFSDVSMGQYYAGYAVWAYEKGIVSGDGSNARFSPDANITREQMCTMLSRFASAMGASLSQSKGSSTFQDDSYISSWAKDSVYAMQRSGVVNGDNNGAFNPLSPASRAEAAAMLQRFNSACGGLSAPNQDPPTVVPPSSGSGNSENNNGNNNGNENQNQDSGGSNTTPPSEIAPPSGQSGGSGSGGDTSDPGSLPDTPATLLGSTVGIQSSTIRVGVLVKTKSIDTSVSSVSLQNLNGSGFEFGDMSGRSFSSGGVSTGDNTINVTTDGSTFTVTDSSGNVVYTTSSGLGIHPVSGGKALTRVNGAYKYFGNFELRQASGKSGYITVINCLDVEDYVKGVVPFEFSNSWPTEAMKVAAVVCRSYVMSYDWSIYGKFGMDIVSGTGTQIYYGRSKSYDESYFVNSDAAVDATQGQYLTCSGRICVTAYSSCDGGQTRSSADVFGTSYSYLVGKADPYEARAKGDVSGYDSAVKNSHKVGLSAWGAYSMAKYYNKSYEAILGFYYTGTNLQYGA